MGSSCVMLAIGIIIARYFFTACTEVSYVAWGLLVARHTLVAHVEQYDPYRLYTVRNFLRANARNGKMESGPRVKKLEHLAACLQR